MLTAHRAMRLRGRDYTPGQAIPDAEWLAVPEQNRRAMVRTRFVVSKELTPSKAEVRARMTQSPLTASAPQTLVQVAAPVATGQRECKVCGAVFPSAGALGGHMRGHSKRGEV